MCFKCLCAGACVLRWGEGSFGCVCTLGGVYGGGMRNAKSLGDLTENFIKKLKSIHTHTHNVNIQEPHMHAHSHIIKIHL